MFINNPDYSIDFWINEVVGVVAIRENISKKDARIRVLECLSYYIPYYEIGLRPEAAVSRFWKE